MCYIVWCFSVSAFCEGACLRLSVKVNCRCETELELGCTPEYVVRLQMLKCQSVIMVMHPGVTC